VALRRGQVSAAHQKAVSLLLVGLLNPLELDAHALADRQEAKPAPYGSNLDDAIIGVWDRFGRIKSGGVLNSDHDRTA
jgi:hypothetical protein